MPTEPTTRSSAPNSSVAARRPRSEGWGVEQRWEDGHLEHVKSVAELIRCRMKSSDGGSIWDSRRKLLTMERRPSHGVRGQRRPRYSPARTRSPSSPTCCLWASDPQARRGTVLTGVVRWPRARVDTRQSPRSRGEPSARPTVKARVDPRRLWLIRNRRSLSRYRFAAFFSRRRRQLGLGRRLTVTSSTAPGRQRRDCCDCNQACEKQKLA